MIRRDSDVCERIVGRDIGRVEDETHEALFARLGIDADRPHDWGSAAVLREAVHTTNDLVQEVFRHGPYLLGRGLHREERGDHEEERDCTMAIAPS